MQSIQMRGVVYHELGKEISVRFSDLNILACRIQVSAAHLKGKKGHRVSFLGIQEEQHYFIPDEGKLTIGRQTPQNPNVLSIEDIFPGLNKGIYGDVSRKHLTIGVRDGRVYFQDTSKAGTVIDGEKLLGMVAIPNDELMKAPVKVNLLKKLALCISINMVSRPTEISYPQGRSSLSKNVPFTIGKNPGCNLQVNQHNFPEASRYLRFVSGTHLTITRDEHHGLIINDSSVNGSEIIIP